MTQDTAHTKQQTEGSRPVKRSQLAQDTPHTTQHTERAHR